MPPEGSPSSPASLGPIPSTLRLKLAHELDEMRDVLEDIGVSLCNDDAVMHRCMTQLQRLDELGQRSMWLAELIRAHDPVARIDDITLGALTERLRA